MRIDEVEKTIEKIQKILDMMKRLEVRKKNVEEYLEQKFTFYELRVKANHWLKKYPKIKQRLENMYCNQVEKLKNGGEDE
jgi:predicted transcriptional regulator